MDSPEMKDASAEFPLKRLLVRLGIWLVLATGILYGVVVWWCASEIAEPKRRQVQAGAAAYLDGTAKAGFAVEKFVSTDGMPCLVCEPEAVGVFSKRAALIRQQFAKKGIVLKPAPEIVGTILILHGRGGIKEDYLPVAERFCAVGFRCVIPDLPGHGKNAGRYTTYGVLEAPEILKCYEEAAEKFHFTQQPCGIFGQSMGGAEAVHTAALEGSPFAAMVVVSSFDRLEAVTRSQANGMLGSVLGAAVRVPADRMFGWKTGVKISEINPGEKAAKIRIPTMIVHGDADTFVPTSAGKALFESFPEDIEKQWIPIPTGSHNNVLITDFPLYLTMAEWFLKYLSPAQGE